MSAILCAGSFSLTFYSADDIGINTNVEHKATLHYPVPVAE